MFEEFWRLTMFDVIVPGMTCNGCARAVTSAVKTADPDAELQIDLDARCVSIISEAGQARMEEAIKEAGFNVGRRAA